MTISSQDNFCFSGNDVTKPSSASLLADSQNISKRLCCSVMAYPEIAIIAVPSLFLSSSQRARVPASTVILEISRSTVLLHSVIGPFHNKALFQQVFILNVRNIFLIPFL